MCINVNPICSTAIDVLIPAEIAQEGSIHSRYSGLGISDDNESKMMVKEGSQSSVSAREFLPPLLVIRPPLFDSLISTTLRTVDERLLGLDSMPQNDPLILQSSFISAGTSTPPPSSDAASCRFQLRDETTDDLLSESISTSEVTSAAAYVCTPELPSPSNIVQAPKLPPDITQVASEEELELADSKDRGPLRVVNRSDSDLSSGSESGESVYSSPEGEDRDSGNLGLSSVRDEVKSDVSSSGDCHQELPNPHPHVILGMSTVREKYHCRCAGDCPVHVYVRELEVRVGALVEENKRLRLGVV